jgi:hypothetical protein
VRRVFIVRDERILAHLTAELGRYLREGVIPRCDVREFDDRRTLDQNAKFHALVDDVARQAEWAGKKRSPESWKALFISGHSIATKQGGEVLPGLEGEFVAIRESSARMGKRRAASLIEYVTAWAVSNGVELREPAYE